MKILSAFFFLSISLLFNLSYAQELVLIQDSVNGFEIGVPEGWAYGVPDSKAVDFIAMRQKQTPEDVPRESFNINFFDRGETDLAKTFNEYLKSIGGTILEQGDVTIQGRRYKFAVETHPNKYTRESMVNYNLFTNNEGRILILTMVCMEENWETFRPLFERVAQSLKY